MNYKKSIFMALALLSGYANCSPVSIYVKRNPDRVDITNDSFATMVTRIADPKSFENNLDAVGTLGDYIIKIQSINFNDAKEIVQGKIEDRGIATGCCRLTIEDIIKSGQENDQNPTSPRSQKLLTDIKERSLKAGDFIYAIAFTRNGAPGLAFLGGPKDNAAAASSSSQKFHCPHCNRDFVGSNSKQHIDNCGIFTTLIKLGVLYHLVNQTQTNNSSHQK